MFDNNSGFRADETESFVGGDSAALRDAYGLESSSYQSNLLWHDPASGENELWLMDGANRVGAPVDIFSVDDGWQVVGSADFDRDGDADLLVRNERTGDNAALFAGGNGDTEFVGRDGITGIGADWVVQGVSDFDSDGQADILWQNQRTHQHVVWYMEGETGANVRERSELRSPGREWDAQGLADFDGDGRTDVLWRNENSGENLVWYMKGNQGNERKDSERVESWRDRDWTLSGVGDFDSNGRPDLLWHNASSNSTEMWEMNGDKNNSVERRVRLTGNGRDWMPFVTNWAPKNFEEDRATDNRATDTGSSVGGGAISDSSGRSSGRSSGGSSNNSNSDREEAGFNIEFDYRFDTNNWFDAQKRTVLEKAADIWEAIILDDFDNIAVGTTVHASDPNGGGLTSFELETEIDDIKVFAFAQNLRGSLAEAGATTYPGDRNTEEIFRPWLGEIVFNDRESWYVNADTSGTLNIPRTQADMLSVAVHEIGHILGISSGISAFRNLIENGEFVGEAARAINNGEPIPLDHHGSHIEDDFEVPGLGENSLDPNIAKGTRKLLTALDVALLDDIGYRVDYSTLKSVPEIEVLSIREGESDKTVLRTNNSYTVRWEDNLSEEVKIELYEGDRYVRTLVNSTPSTGEFTWRVTPDLAGDRYYRIRVSSVDDSSVFDTSGRPFRVEQNRYINIDTPSDNYPIRTGSQFELTWSDNISETVKIELYKDNAPYRVITASTKSDGSYQWTLPRFLDSSRNYHLRFTSTSDSSVYDESAKFWIQR